MIILFNLLAQPWFLSIVSAIGTAIAGLISYYIMELVKHLAKKTKNQRLLAAIELMQNVVVTVVSQVQQTFVAQLKKDGKFDKEAQQEALRRAIKLVLAQAKPEAVEIISGAHGDFMQWVEIQIEAAIYQYMPHSNNSTSIGVN